MSDNDLVRCQSFQSSELFCSGVEGPEGIAAENKGGSNMEDVVRPKPVLRGVAMNEVAELSVENGVRNDTVPNQKPILQLREKGGLGQESHLRSDAETL